MPEPKDPDQPAERPAPDYEPGNAPQEFPAAPPVGDPQDGRPRD